VVLLHGFPASSFMLRDLIPVPVLAVWGRNDEIFRSEGELALAQDAPGAIHLMDGGHFLLESTLDAVAGYIRGFLGRMLS
jgi:pimeloyl-ACP methyl ester carboxylesterase